MLNKVMDLSHLKLAGKSSNSSVKKDNISHKDIAVIGMSARFSSANNIDEYWESLCKGKDFINDFPSARKIDNEQFIEFWNRSGIIKDNNEYNNGGFLKEIDKFDYSFFNMSPREAELMDPNQRIFLQTIWEAIEEAGYGGKKLAGTNTGVFVGYSSDSGEEYKKYLQVLAPSIYQPMEPGNIKSIIASRISYLLDLKGASIMVDTACSSSLVAIHLAVQSIRNGDCEMAIAGGIKINLVPLRKIKNEDGLGIESFDGRTRTFDDSSDGIGIGEGAGVLVLKPLDRALSDRDHIYAVIKGSAVNQDGASIGITAPNASAQQDVILKAWKDSEINPETISYIECHGTGTKLGDPVEINGIERAFRRHTRKKQFCAVGSVKTNIGHTDNVAGVASIIKAILALKNKKIPPSINFKKPNRKIAFEDSPVYINDMLQEWEAEGFPRRCGVSSFGLSGTNCHVVLEEYLDNRGACSSEDKGDNSINGSSVNILALSAKDKEVLDALVKLYRDSLKRNPEYSLKDICYTSNTGRGHYNSRLAIIANDTTDLLEKISKICEKGLHSWANEGIYFGEHKIVPAMKREKNPGEITDEEKRLNSTQIASIIKGIAGNKENRENKASFREICELYINGADANWEGLYEGCKNKRLSLPAYPFSSSRCWIKPEVIKITEMSIENEKKVHPLINRCIVESNGISIYSTIFSVDRHWVLNEHKVAGTYVIPGTTYIEAARHIGKTILGTETVELKDIMFLTPFSVNAGEEKEIHGAFKGNAEGIEFSFSSKSRNDIWVVHAEGKILKRQKSDQMEYDLGAIKGRLTKEEFVDYGNIKDWAVEVGNRFKNLRVIHSDENEALAYLELSEEYHNDLKELYLHPALLDSAVNMANSSAGSGLYLPLSYKSLRVYNPLPSQIYCYLRKKNRGKVSQEVSTFQISVLDLDGNLLVEAEDYTVKKVHENEVAAIKEMNSSNSIYEISWIPDLLKESVDNGNERFVVIKDKTGFSDKLISTLKSKGKEVIEVEEGNEFEIINEYKFIFDNTEQSYNRLLESIGTERSFNLVHCLSIEDIEVKALQDLEGKMRRGAFSLFCLTKALIANKINQQVKIFVISDYANDISGYESIINPHNGSLFGLCKVIPQENIKIQVRCIDIDKDTKCENIYLEIIKGTGATQIGCRENVRYRPEFRKIKLADKYEKEIGISSTGVYLITGGLGGIGLEVAGFISRKAPATLCLVNRTVIPERSMWDAVLEEGNDTKLCKKIRAIIEIEKSGSHVICCSADVSDIGQMSNLINKIRNKYGRINGVIHGAGIAGDGFIIKKDEQTFETVLRPKIVGTYILEQLTEQDNLDFFIMFSSITSLLGVPGQSDYTAGNSFLDSFSAYMAKKGRKALAINWPAWKETGMAYDYGAVQEDTIFKPLTTASALNAFGALMYTDLKRAIPIELNYSMFDGYNDDQAFILSEDIKNMINTRNGSDVGKSEKNTEQTQKINIKGKSFEDCSETELKLAQIWGKVFAVGDIDVFASISELGGDSLMATKLLKEMEKEFAGFVDISDIFTYPTIFEMAEYIGSKGKSKEIPKLQVHEADEDNIDEILKKLSSGEMSLTEAESLLR